MSKLKPLANQNTKLSTPMCQKMMACDGSNLAPAARARGYCDRCKTAMDKREARKAR